MKEFNVTGTCIPERHYMVDIKNKLDQIESLVEKGKYFTINRPRQYGKTTTIFLLSKRLAKRKDYLVISISFEGMSSKVFSAEESFIKSFLREIKRNLKLRNETDLIKVLEDAEIENIDELGYLLTDLILTSNKELVLIIDEVDKSSNNQLFLDFLGMLRSKYLLAQREEDKTFHSVILVGVHDVKNLKLKLRPNDERKYNSPWNIAVDFDVDLSFNPNEIATMLKEYKEEREVEVDVMEVAKKIHYYTSGHPYLVSKLAKVIDEKILPQKENKSWDLKDIEEAVKIILNKGSVNFESLIKNLENNQELYQLVYELIMEGQNLSYNPDNPIINLGELYGVFAKKNGRLKVHNRVYEQRIYNYMSSKLETTLDMKGYNFRENFIKTDGYLDFKKILRKFQLFIKEQYSDKDQEFLERNGRLIFLAFIKPIINGQGFDFKEVQISQEKRLDVVITYLDEKYVVELKIWRGEKYHQKGLEQLADYLDQQSLEQGYLVSFNFNQNKEYKEEEITKNGKDIFAVWV
ncbi:AAA-like domain-containing protein [Natroniella sulfidigena]|uniref:AAA-like domain-containing protein n=1 Tax=Natroniella sulfidigena TaxID=723921 RepID=UPI00200B23DE|nr:AAA-like domain-containing protein [Natroniella sulfidigena]MCK8816287.1 AAA-like domain-containing protein [Natroniella sulfidigena]